MKKTIKLFGIITLVAVIGFSMAACGGGEKSINSADALKTYLDSKPANGPDKPIKVAMKINENMVGDIREAINSAGKYVSLNLTGSPLTTIPSKAFQNCRNLVAITIPNSVTSIDDSAFSDCTGLTSVTIPTSVTSIDDNAFSDCTGLTSISIPESVTYIGNNTFSDCTGLTSVTIPTSVTSIGGRAFYKCTNLASVTIPTSVTSIGGGAFSHCTSLTSITIPESVTYIGFQSFSGWNASQTIYIKGHANRESTINAGWAADPPKQVWWNSQCEANIVYQGQ